MGGRQAGPTLMDRTHSPARVAWGAVKGKGQGYGVHPTQHCCSPEAAIPILGMDGHVTSHTGAPRVTHACGRATCRAMTRGEGSPVMGTDCRGGGTWPEGPYRPDRRQRNPSGAWALPPHPPLEGSSQPSPPRSSRLGPHSPRGPASLRTPLPARGPHFSPGPCPRAPNNPRDPSPRSPLPARAPTPTPPGPPPAASPRTRSCR